MNEKAKVITLKVVHKKPIDKVETMKDLFIKNFIKKQTKKLKP